MRIYSWNVNGLRAVLNKGALQEFLVAESPDILCLQEIKCKPNQCGFDFNALGYQIFWNPAERPGYSGTAILARNELSSVKSERHGGGNPEVATLFSSALDLPAQDVIHWSAGRTALTGEPVGDVRNMRPEQANLDYFYASENSVATSEGRVLVLEFSDFYLVNVYTPNSKPDLSRLKLREKDWDPGFLQYLKELEKTKPVVTCGDFNAAHEEIDIARPKTNHHSAGFTDEERQGISNLIDAGFIDTFRFLHPNSVRYTWWSHWGKARENNIGWRIDYFFVSKILEKKLKNAEIYENHKGSDHCPISIELEV